MGLISRACVSCCKEQPNPMRCTGFYFGFLRQRDAFYHQISSTDKNAITEPSGSVSASASASASESTSPSPSYSPVQSVSPSLSPSASAAASPSPGVPSPFNKHELAFERNPFCMRECGLKKNKQNG